MAGFDPRSFGIHSRTDIGTFLLCGGLAGFVEAVFNFAESDPITVGAMIGVAAVGAKKLLFDSDSEPPHDSPPPQV